MIEPSEYAARVEQWGVPSEQVYRDHLISHALAALSVERGFVFFGGTALNRTHLPDLRLSEDIDLFAAGPDNPLAQVLSSLQVLGREFPGFALERGRRLADVETYRLLTDRAGVKLQMAGHRVELAALPAAPTPVRLRYSDLPDAVDLTVPTRDAFAAMKLAAFADRKAPRDLFDLDGLLGVSGSLEEAVSLHKSMMGYPPPKEAFRDPPDHEPWEAELGHQMRHLEEPSVVLERVRRAVFDVR